MCRAHLVVPAVEADLVKVLRANDEVVALGAGVVVPEWQAVRVLEALVRIEELADLPVAHACVRAESDNRTAPPMRNLTYNKYIRAVSMSNRNAQAGPILCDLKHSSMKIRKCKIPRDTGWSPKCTPYIM